MKVILYLDVFPGQDVKYLCATSNPGRKAKWSARYAIEVHLPDPNQPDEVLPVHNVVEVDKE